MTALGMLLFHIVAGYAVWRMFTTGFSAAAWYSFVVLWIIAMIGVSVGYHRHATHQSFECHWLVERILYWFAAMAWEGTGIIFGRDHTRHHTFTDLPGDTHSPKEYGGGFRGFLWSHMGWLIFDAVPVANYQTPLRFRKDPSLIWQKRYYLPLALSGFALSFFTAGWDGVYLGFLRVVLAWHVTWGVNSLCHMFGTHAVDGSGHALDTRYARNFPLHCVLNIFALISGGEFWHGNHHAHQGSAYLGWRWYEFDPGRWVIQLMEHLRLAWNVRIPQRAG